MSQFLERHFVRPSGQKTRKWSRTTINGISRSIKNKNKQRISRVTFKYKVMLSLVILHFFTHFFLKNLKKWNKHPKLRYKSKNIKIFLIIYNQKFLLYYYIIAQAHI